MNEIYLLREVILMVQQLITSFMLREIAQEKQKIILKVVKFGEQCVIL